MIPVSCIFVFSNLNLTFTFYVIACQYEFGMMPLFINHAFDVWFSRNYAFGGDC